LRPREKFFIDRAAAYREKRADDAARLAEDYFAKYPDDPYIVDAVAAVAFNRDEAEKAERLYRRLLEVAPNWVTAYNQLGYITMRQGRFPEAEEYFTSYRFIAPDQANPHDSLAELYTIQGRYDDAQTSLENAIEIRPEFWPSYFHLIQTRIMMRDFDGARQALERWRAQDGAVEGELGVWACAIEYAELVEDRSWNEILDSAPSACVEEATPLSYPPRAVHRAACQVGDWDLAQQYEAALRQHIEKVQNEDPSKMADVAKSLLLNMEATRLALRGDYEDAETRFRDADAQMQYLETGPGIFKLVNRLQLVETLFAQGRDVEAHKLLAKVRGVNPSIVENFEADGLKILGLERG
jgi:Flp pilus assembly protein TadD